MANISANWKADGQRFNTATDMYYTAVESAVVIYKGSLVESHDGENTLRFAENTASASAMGVMGEKITGDGTARGGHYVNGEFEMEWEGATAYVGKECYAGTAPNIVQRATSTGPKVGKVTRILSSGNVKIRIDGYANV